MSVFHHNLREIENWILEGKIKKTVENLNKRLEWADVFQKELENFSKYEGIIEYKKLVQEILNILEKRKKSPGKGWERDWMGIKKNLGNAESAQKFTNHILGELLKLSLLIS